jgi:cell division protein FtsQ
MNKDNKQRFKAFLWLILLVSLTGITLAAAKFHADEVISGVKAEVILLDKGNNLILPEDIVKTVLKKFGPLEGIPIDLVDMRSIEEFLSTSPYVKEASVFLGASGQLTLSIRQRMPIMRVVDNRGTHWYIDADTVRMPVSRNFTARVPLVNGDFPVTNDVRTWPITSLFDITMMLQENEFMGSLIDQIYLESKEKIWLVPRMGPSKILIGNTDILDDKVERIQKFYKKALPSTGWDTYAYIDTRFAGQIVAKRRLNQ